MNRALEIFTPEYTGRLFGPERTAAFFEALFGGAEEGAYDIRLAFVTAGEDSLEFAFNLHQRPGKCLACNLTYGLPAVFARHPVIGAARLAEEIAKAAGRPLKGWKLGETKEHGKALHSIPFWVTVG